MRLLTVALIVATSVAGCGSSERSPSSSPAATPVESGPQATTTSIDLANVRRNAFADIRLAGKGNQTAKFKIPENAAAIAIATHAGIKNFAIAVVDETGEQTGQLVNTIGSYRGTTLFDLDANEHSVAFKVTADGPWTIVVKPVAEAPVWNPKTQLSGTGDHVYVVSPPNTGPETIDLAYRGGGAFMVNAITPGTRDLLANQTRNFSATVQLPDTTILLDVQANGGAWIATPG